MKKKIAMAFLLATLAATPVYAAEVQDFGTAGNVSVQQQPNDNGGSDDWIVVSPGESGRGVKIVDENGKAVVSVDRYGGVYVDGKLYVNGKLLESPSHLKFGEITSPGRVGESISLGRDEYFVLSDNLESGEDSRSESIGNVTRKMIRGRIWFRM